MKDMERIIRDLPNASDFIEQSPTLRAMAQAGEAIRSDVEAFLSRLDAAMERSRAERARFSGRDRL